ncbi:unnamed protein product, partial [Tuber aestivum]
FLNSEYSGILPVLFLLASFSLQARERATHLTIQNRDDRCTYYILL